MTDLRIPDVSHYQGTINWSELGSVAPVVIIKAANDGKADSRFKENQIGARSHCEVIGYYQYLTPKADPVAAAKALQSIVGALIPGREFLILDLESGSGDQSARMTAWNNTIPGDTEVDYAGLSFWKTQLSGVKNAKHRWIAAYRSQEPGEVHTLWQYTDKQPFKGISAPCDASIFHGDVAALKANLGLVSKAPVKPPVHKGGWVAPAWPGHYLKNGDSGDSVEKLKKLLVEAGYGRLLNMKGSAARKFGPATARAVKKLQAAYYKNAKKKKGTPDGIVGPVTWKWLTDVVTVVKASAK